MRPDKTIRLLTAREAQAHDKETEAVLREVTCPWCSSGPDDACIFDDGMNSVRSHVARYRAAAGHGLVPPLPGETKESSARLAKEATAQ